MNIKFVFNKNIIIIISIYIFPLSLDPIRAYKTKDIVLQLPGETTIFDIAWLAVFDLTTNENLGSVIMTEHLNVPPSLVTVIVSILNNFDLYTS